MSPEAESAARPSGSSIPAGRIRRLGEAVANQIAAGEVVERPASVVKELVENALDAEATRIQVDIESGGQDLVRVTDDGIGMNRQDAELCLERHATSKIRAAVDLETVATMGFRGEAMPSIASVSRFVLLSRARGEDEGTRVVVEGGRTVRVEAAGAAPGTVVEVRDLFFNVPARRKFLKRPQTEQSHIGDALARLALARPEVAFRLVADGREVLEVAPASKEDPRGRLGRILGRAVAERLHPIPDDAVPHAIEVRGFFSEPALSERTAGGLHVFVNRRFIRDRTIQHAITDAYRTLLEKGRYPVVVLFLEMDPRTFDVNVHPQKVEVRFARTSDVHRAVSGALGRALAAQPWIRTPAPVAEARRYALRSDPGSPAREAEAAPWSNATEGGPARGAQEHAARIAGAMGALGRSGFGGKGLERFLGGVTPPSFRSGAPRGLEPPEADPTALEGRGEQRDRALEGPARQEAPLQVEADLGGPFSRLRPVGQILGTFLVCEGEGRMVLIDQHAAHERIAFERLRTEGRARAVRVQPLLLPLTLELDPARSQVAHAEVERLAAVGVEIEHFGGQTWLVKSSPAALGAAKLERLVIDLLDELKAVERTTPVEEQMEALFACAACHTVVRAGDQLGTREIEALLAQMDEIDFGAHCPHGRPVFVEWSEGELFRLFHRT